MPYRYRGREVPRRRRHRAVPFWLALLGTLACSEPDFPETWDADGDGYGTQDDCDPDDPTVYPGAVEICDDGIDSDCAGDLETTEVDNDGDGFSECGGDCDDGDDDRFPGNSEACDGKDNDCAAGIPTGETDVDGDGYFPCQGDCDDGDTALNPEDNDGDGYSPCDDPPDCDDEDALLHPVDEDHDGYSPCDGDCDEYDPLVHPAAVEICDLVDNDCDGIQDPTEVDHDGDGDPACSDCDDGSADLNLHDSDGDGFSTCDGDCDDSRSTVHPNGYETCNGVDEDCDGVVDDGVDQDGDGWFGCGGDDCDDANAEVHPNAIDLCDGLDQDCDGLDGNDQGGDIYEPNDDSLVSHHLFTNWGTSTMNAQVLASIHDTADEDWFYVYQDDAIGGWLEVLGSVTPPAGVLMYLELYKDGMLVDGGPGTLSVNYMGDIIVDSSGYFDFRVVWESGQPQPCENYTLDVSSAG